MPRLWEDVITGEKKRFDGEFPLGEVFSTFPVALLLGNQGHP
jgi:maltooligosyltrehalose synthase